MADPRGQSGHGPQSGHGIHCGQLILREISKSGATRCQILRLKAPNSISAGAPPQTPLGELTAFLRPLAVFEGPTSKGREGKEGRAREGGGKGKERVGEGKRVEGCPNWGVWIRQ